MLTVANYWAEAFSNAKIVQDLLQIQDWMSRMEATVQNAQNIHGIGSSKPPPTAKTQGSNEDGTAIKIISGPMFGLDDLNVNEIDYPPHSYDFMVIFDGEEESGGSQHSISKPKEKKKKNKMAVTRKEFLNLQDKVDKILPVVTTPQLQQTKVVGSQSLAEQVERIETRERLAVERISLNVEMGIRALDSNRTADHKEFLAAAERLIQEVSAIKAELQYTTVDQAVQTKKLVEETHNAYRSTIAVLQSTINNLRRYLSASSHG